MFERLQTVAVKQMIVPMEGLSEEEVREFLVEIKLSSLLQHKYVVGFVGITFPSEDEICFVTEYMHRGNVRKLLRKKASNIPAKMRFQFASSCNHSRAKKGLTNPTRRIYG